MRAHVRPTTNRARTELLLRLAQAGTWASREQLAEGLDWSEARFDDELADLVTSGAALWNERMREYRLAGAPMARRAAQQLLRRRERRMMVARQLPGQPLYQVGLARVVGQGEGASLVMAELELPYPSGDLGALERMAAALTAWADEPATAASAASTSPSTAAG